MPVKPDIATILAPDGSVANLPCESISDEDLRLLLAYKKWLQKNEYREAVYCQRCFGNNMRDGTDFSVKTSGLTVEAMVKCRCRIKYGKGGGLH